ncbi:hypothetical protein KTT_44720 [Tengunoibacter tsumagoiensis]|uniref:Carrier domain-containing protein n=2 Tax=Tengunoibacter tsumagoiensis TaxID=2014871 RepID=A0A402A643_9CHLR|nr:hypothetical protein KTT_44720 [Tengunoibacter tsumagoiensis]
MDQWSENLSMLPKDSDPPFTALFEQQARLYAEKPALVFADRSLSYRELNGQADSLARSLIDQGVRPEMRIGLYFQRSLEMIIALLGVLKAGAAFVPLDPAYPRERIAFLLADAHLSFVLTHSTLRAELSSVEATVLSLDTLAPVVDATDGGAFHVEPEQSAYVIYTSGSTGVPKGVVVTQRGLSHLAHAFVAAIAPVATDHILQFASLSFDASLSEIVSAFSVGATLYLAEKEDLIPGPALEATLLRNAISVVTLPPSILALLPQRTYPALRTIVVAGEACPASLVERWGSHVTFINAYGPTEIAVCATTVQCHPQQPVTIGSPLASTSVYLLDEDLQPVPSGTVGELYLAGPGLARGYLERPALTAERFLPDPFAAKPGARMYRTGDLGRLAGTGELEFLGRIDFQVKLRGFRIELGEIEAVLSQHPLVQEAVVLLREDRPADPRLVAYLKLHPESPFSWHQLRADLAQRLPVHMVPGTVVVVEQWPLTLNQKIDRAALPAPANAAASVDERYVAPQTPIEESLAEIWSSVLHVERVGRFDHFLELGGNSLLTTQVQARIRDELKLELPLKVLFRQQTIAELAESLVVEQAQEVQPLSLGPRICHESVPLSYSQERVWFLQQLDPSSKAYNAQAAIRLSGQLVIEAFEQSLSEIVRRHEIFRTTFSAHHGIPAQTIHPPFSVNIPLIHLEHLSPDEQDRSLSQVMQETFSQPFDTAQLPLVRWILVCLSDTESVFLHVEHHFIHDGWSFAVFLRELCTLYAAFVKGERSPLPPLPLQFADFVLWQREWMEGTEAASQLSYWLQQLADHPARLELLTDRPRPLVQTFRGSVERITLSDSLYQQVRAYCRQEHCTLFMFLFSAFLLLLYRYTDQDDLCIGTGIANRRFREIESLIGMIINTVVLRAHLSKQLTFRELVEQVRQVTLDAYAHQDLPFGKVVEALQPERNASYSPLYQVAFSFHDSPLPPLTMPDLTLELNEGLSNHTAKFDLNVIVIPRREQFVGQAAAEQNQAVFLLWEYNTDLFDRSTIQRFIAHYEQILTSVLQDDHQSLQSVPLLTRTEREQILVTLGHTQGPAVREEATLQQVFDEQVQRNPSAPALHFADEQLSYGEVNQRANQLAATLRMHGVTFETPVGIFMERSASAIISMLAVLKLGGTYLPLDPDYPLERLLFMLQNVNAPFVVSQQELYERLSGYQGTILSLTDFWSEPTEWSGENIVTSCPATALASILYTSGSTGQPKGIGLTHQAMIATFYQETTYFSYTRPQRFSQISNLAFDAAAFEIWGSLLNGHLLVGIEREQSLSAPALQRIIEDQHIETCFLTTALVHQFARQTPAFFKQLHTLFTGGEAAEARLINAIFEQGGPAALINCYGPTECTTFATTKQLFPQTFVSVPIGRPVGSTQVVILDETLSPVPIGVAGEIYLGGIRLARGYPGRPDLTAERFIPNPFSALPGGRLYRTGDRARFLNNGDIEFLGRLDSQIKLRGFRIELAEIESVLEQHPLVASSLVILTHNPAGESCLIAYLVLTADAASLAETISWRSYLLTRLPEYMIPAQFVVLTTFPLTANGKIDRRALPAPDWEQSNKGEQEERDRTQLEEAIAQIWEEVLGRTGLSLFANFFQLGGHSLLATQIVTRVNEALQLQVPLRTLLIHPTIADFASAILQEQLEELDQEQFAELLAELELPLETESRE